MPTAKEPLNNEVKFIPREMMLLKNLMPAPWNYKEEGLDKIDKFRNAIRAKGFLYGLIVAQREEEPKNNKYEVVDGNHRLDVLRQEEMKEVPVYNYGRMSLTKRKRLSIEFNEWRFESDSVRLGKAVEIMAKEIDLADIASELSFDEEMLSGFLEMAAFDFDEEYNDYVSAAEAEIQDADTSGSPFTGDLSAEQHKEYDDSESPKQLEPLIVNFRDGQEWDKYTQIVTKEKRITWTVFKKKMIEYFKDQAERQAPKNNLVGEISSPF